MSPTRADVLLAYRRLFQHLLRAVQYSKPARFVVRDRMRDAFRKSPIESFDARRIERTLEFVKGAASHKGLEHKVVKNLMFVWWERQKLLQRQYYRADLTPHRLKAYEDFDLTIEMLNESMGLCIK